MAAMEATPGSSTGTADAPPTVPAPKKKLHGRAFYESIGSPKCIVAPMVDQSEFAWRMLSRSFLPESQRCSILAYSPMLHSRLFAGGQKYRDTHFQPTREPWAGEGFDPAAALTPFLDGNPAIDRPLFVQFASHDPDALLAAAEMVAPYCDAVDLNLGCPQGIAKRGHYGAFLQEDQDLIFRLINTLHEKLSIPVTAKIRMLETREATLEYAQNVLRAGASILTVHGRLREQKGHLTGVADWDMIRYLRDNLPPDTVLFANGNILLPEDIDACLAATGVDGVMSAEGNLSNPAIFAPAPAPGDEAREYWRPRDGRDGGWRVDAVFRRYLDIMYRYVREQEPPTRRPLFVVGDDTTWLAAPPPPPPAAALVPMTESQLQQQASAKRAADFTIPSAADDDDEPPTKKQKHQQKHQQAPKKPEKYLPTTNYAGMQGHLFHLLRHLVTRHTDVRDALARARLADMGKFEAVLDMVERKVAEGLLEDERSGGATIKREIDDEIQLKFGNKKKDHKGPKGEEEENGGESSLYTVRRCKRPWWVVQPVIRPLPSEALAKGAIQPKKAKGNNDCSNSSSVVKKAALVQNGNGNGAAVPVPAPAQATAIDETLAALDKTTPYPSSELVSG
ncbi:dihydrouridine synthase-domain-containing protein [Lasiosphaeria miniovina]|uniref:tRNA-dihydrouridine(16/17) synthase [NAD(P)(+)] n=1 Tax=Lasiosphaeria miniovina TaxID=1954250 RepID=A0AA40AVT8_9PEZI|nr:dihydrouridine synthase-domain-containing protein [Lasiosphaeria miniovina]KAK0722873.1 dihydrouridine synthase-domain-containing protein [Lasiosphaeria miniovina]